MSAPILITGMHRSGTTLVARMLEAAGWFGGSRKDGYHEALLFPRINKWLLIQAGATWDLPPLADVWDDDPGLEFCTTFVRRVLSGPRLLGYLGRWHWQPIDEVPRFSFPWGYKDPRLTLTLPVWQALYPDMRVIFVTRHGVDVARSLVRRRDERLSERRKSLKKKALRYWRHQSKRRIVEVGIGDLTSGLRLWQTYNRRFHQWSSDRDHVAHIRYEDLLVEPRLWLEQLCRNVGLDPSDEQLERAASMAQADRAYAYLRDDDAREFARRNEKVLTEFGYEA